MNQCWKNFSSSLGNSTSAQGTELHNSLQKYFTYLQMHKWVAKHLYSSKTSPFYGISYMHAKPHGFSNASFTEPLTTEARCFVVDMTTTSTDTQSTLPLSHSARHYCDPTVPSTCSIP